MKQVAPSVAVSKPPISLFAVIGSTLFVSGFLVIFTNGSAAATRFMYIEDLVNSEKPIDVDTAMVRTPTDDFWIATAGIMGLIGLASLIVAIVQYRRARGPRAYPPEVPALPRSRDSVGGVRKDASAAVLPQASSPSVRISVPAFIGSCLLLTGVVALITTWVAGISRYMYVEDLMYRDFGNRLGLTDETVGLVSRATPTDKLTVIVAVMTALAGVAAIVVALIQHRAERGRSR